jgi:RNA polymerase II subunit A small phosphatase-like protein
LNSELTNLLILDIDETLLFASRSGLGRAPDFSAGEYHIYTRPHLERFIAFAMERFRVAVWSQSTSVYVRTIVENIFDDPARLVFAWGGERCTFVTNPAMRQYYWVKDLRKVRRLGYDLRRVIFIDDTARKLERSYGNLVRVQPFTGDAEDDELLHLIRYLDLLDREENIRVVEKRRWRESLADES